MVYVFVSEKESFRSIFSFEIDYSLFEKIGGRGIINFTLYILHWLLSNAYKFFQLRF